MSQVQNLLDMFRNERKDAQAKGAKAPESKSRATAKGAQNLLPLEAADKGNPGATSPKSFQAKIDASRAKLAAKPEHQASQDHAPEAKTARDARNADADRAKSDRRDQMDRSDRSAREDRSDRADRSAESDRRDRAERADEDGKTQGSERAARAGKGRMQSRKAAADAQNAQDASRPAETAQGRMMPATPVATDAPAITDGGDAQADAALEQLKQGLESLGIKADDAQLQDPAFLSDLLQMLQTLPAQPAAEAAPETDTDADTAQAAVAVPIADAENAPTPMDAGLAALAKTDAAAETLPQDADAQTVPADEVSGAPVESKPADRKELAALIRNRIDELTRPVITAAPGQTAPMADAAGAANTPGQSGWKGLKLRPQAETAPTQPMPMADLDRMRVLQAAALQAANAGKETAHASLAGADGETGAVDAVQDAGNPVTYADRADDAAAHGDAGTADQGADTFGRNGEASRGGEAAQKNGAPAAKDGANVPQFQANLEQARSIEHRSGVQRAWEPRPAFEPSALEQIAKKLSAVAHKSGEEMNIQLSPEHLGKVRVSLEMKDGSMSARIGVENDDVRKQVEAGITTLRNALENQGIKLQGLEVSVDQRHGSLFNPDGSNSESFFHRNGKGGQGSQAAAEVAPFESAPESDTGRRLGYNTMEYIG